jgi:RNA polymerase sigma-70 factor (ECF subfamily)
MIKPDTPFPGPGMEQSDDDLLGSALDGDEDALTTLLERHGPQVRRSLDISPKWQSIVDADDVMQVTYLEAFLRIRAFKPSGPGSFVRWLMRIAENNLRDAIKEQQRNKRPPVGRRVEAADQTSYIALIEQLSGSVPTPSRAAGANEIVRSVEKALAELPEDYERVLRQFELEGRSGPEVAQEMGRSHGAIKMLLARARDRLREELGSSTQFFSGPA